MYRERPTRGNGNKNRCSTCRFVPIHRLPTNSHWEGKTMAVHHFVAGIVVGAAAAVAVPVVLLGLAGVNSRVMTRTMLRTKDILGDKARETAAELQETFEDFMA